MSEEQNPRDSLRRPVPPPALFVVIFVAGLVAAYFLPLRFLPDTLPARLGVGMPLFALAALFGAWGSSTFRRSGATAEFGKPVVKLVQTGPFRFTRNPIYLALVLVLAGFAAVLDNAWLAIGVPLLVLALDRLVVVHEERFLAERFGGEYAAYRRRVRRWI